MQDSLLYIILVLIGIVIYLLISQRKNKVEPKDHSQEINNLKDSINSENSRIVSFLIYGIFIGRLYEKNKGIYGTASKEEIKELKEEGINAEMIPWLENKNN